MAAELKTKLTLDNREFLRGLNRANESGRAFNTNLSGQRSGAMGAVSAVKGLAGSYLALKAAQFALKTASKGLALSNSVETETTRLKVLLGSMGEAEQLMNRVMAKAGETPLQTAELQAATRQLIAFGSSSSGVIDELTRLGDLSAGVGMGIGELAEIYGKARVQGTLFAEDINLLTGRGIPIIAEFAKILGVAESEVKKMASEGKIQFPQLEQAIKNLTSEGGQFAGMMEEMAQTGEGAISTLRDNFDQLMLMPLGDWVKSWLDPMVDGLNDASDSVKGMTGATGAGVATQLDSQSRSLWEELDNVENSEQLAELQKRLAEVYKENFSKASILSAGTSDLSEAIERGARVQFGFGLQEMIDQAAGMDPAALDASFADKKAKEAAAARAAQIKKDEDAKLDIAQERHREKAQRNFEGRLDSASPEDAARMVAFELEKAQRLFAKYNGKLNSEFGDLTLEEYQALVEKADYYAGQIDSMTGRLEKLGQAPDTLDDEPPGSSPLDADIPPERLDAPQLDRFARMGLFTGGELMPNLEKDQLNETRKINDRLDKVVSNTALWNRGDSSARWA